MRRLARKVSETGKAVPMKAPPDHAADDMSPSDPERLAELAARYTPALRQYFSRKVDAAAADDLVQDVFIQLQKRAEQGSLQDVERYLFTIAKRVLLNRQRTEMRRSSSAHRTFDEMSHAADDISPERILEAKQEYARAVVAITDLPPRMRTVFFLHRFGKLSYSAIAKRMGITKGSVQVLMERALSHVMRDMGEEP